MRLRLAIVIVLTVVVVIGITDVVLVLIRTDACIWRTRRTLHSRSWIGLALVAVAIIILIVDLAICTLITPHLLC